jgi:hypothetical protein
MAVWDQKPINKKPEYLPFRRNPWQYDVQHQWYYSICEEFIDGRWEGFLAFKIKQEIEHK